MMSSQSCMVPSWNLRNLKQPQQEKAVEEEQEQQVAAPQVNPQPHHHHHHRHHHHHQNPSPTPVPKPNYEVAELTWENGQLAMHGIGEVLPPAATTQTSKPTWGRIGDTLESFVLQATCQNQLAIPKQNGNQNAGNMSSMVASSSNKWGDSSGHMQVTPSFLKKRVRSSAISNDSGRNVNCSAQEERNHPDMSACASVSATMSKDNDTTMMTWPSFDSPNWSFKSKATDDDDVSENKEEERNNKGETTRSHSARPSRAAAVHNQSERRRRDRINQKMKALQKLVPNASKTDKASMLDEVIEYLKNLQSQVQMMNTVRTTMPAATQMMMPAAALQQMQQQQLQMSMLAARMGMGMGSVGLGMGIGMGMMPQSLSPSTSHSFVPPQFVMPQMIQSHSASQIRNGAQTPNTSVPFADPYSTFLAQSMNMDMYNKMAKLYRQQVSQAAQSMASPSGSKGES